jgi:hypothetical protein
LKKSYLGFEFLGKVLILKQLYELEEYVSLLLDGITLKQRFIPAMSDFHFI